MLCTPTRDSCHGFVNARECAALFVVVNRADAYAGETIGLAVVAGSAMQIGWELSSMTWGAVLLRGVGSGSSHSRIERQIFLGQTGFRWNNPSHHPTLSATSSNG